MKEFSSFSRKGTLKYFLRKFKQQKRFCPELKEMHYRFASIITTAGGLCMHVNKYGAHRHV